MIILKYLVFLFTIKTIKCHSVCHVTGIFSYYMKELKDICVEKKVIESKSVIQEPLTINIYNNSKREMANNSTLNNFYRPRSALARALYEKQRNDGNLRDFDKTQVTYFFYYF